MPNEKKTMRDVASSMRATYQKAVEAKTKGNLSYAIELMKSVVQKEPAFMEARERLREFEKSKPPANFFSAFMDKMRIAKIVGAGQIDLARKKYLDAMAKAEDALAINVRDGSALKLLATAAEGAEYPFIAVESLEMAAALAPNDLPTLKNLADLYNRVGMASEELRVRQKIASMLPDDLDAQAAVRAASAAATMQANWAGGESFRDKMKSKDEAKRLEQQDRVARNIDDIKELIEDLERKAREEGESLDVLKKLGDLYQRGNEHATALKYLKRVTELMGTLDPAIDRAIEKSEVALMDAEIAAIEGQPGAESKLAELRKRRYDYRYGRAADRVAKYPNDLLYKFDFGQILWEGGDIDGAIREFQQAQRNPNKRLVALVFLARCFHAKGQIDISIDTFKKALSEMLSMDKQKMEALYYLAHAYEANGDKASAKECYKQIYMTDSSFMDVSARYQSM